MKYEVEQKFHIGDLDAIEQALKAVGSQISEIVSQTDTYLSHPTRDFGKTDEAFRLRRDGEANLITYKGPKIDQVTKTRRELELALPSGQEFPIKFEELLMALGFGVFLHIKKQRRRAIVHWQGARIEVSLDQVENLGIFVELETAAEESELVLARERMASLAQELGLTRNERLSYCELMLKRRENAMANEASCPVEPL